MLEFFQSHIGEVIKSAIALVITLVCSIVEHHLFKRVYPRLRGERHTWVLALVKALHAPLQVFIWFFGASIAADIWTHFLDNSHVMAIYKPVRVVIGVILVIWFFSAFVTQIERQMMKKAEGGRLDKMTVRAIGQVLRALFIFAGFILILQIVFRIPISGIMALAGGGGLTIGFGAKDLIANFFGGMMIFLDRPFSIGSRITVLEKDIQGVVEHIGWRMTIIRVDDDDTIHIPNSLFLNLLVKTRFAKS